MAVQFFVVLVAVAAAVSSRCCASWSESNATTIYEVLSEHGLPMGLFPRGVKQFAVGEDGRFWVHLDEACNAKFENELHYERNVSGQLSYGMIDALSGLEAQDLFLWFQVMSIRVDVPSTGLIYFDVGAASKRFPLALFETPPECVTVRSQYEHTIPQKQQLRPRRMRIAVAAASLSFVCYFKTSASHKPDLKGKDVADADAIAVVMQLQISKNLDLAGTDFENLDHKENSHPHQTPATSPEMTHS
ncbi:hypothetical protein CR513_37818, partial [Mucuna pruriens]